MTQAIGRSTAEPSLSTALMHLFDRYVNGAPDADEADRIVAELLPRHGVNRDMLSAFVADYKKVPEAVRAKVTPPELLKAPTATPLSKTARSPLILTRKVPVAAAGVVPPSLEPAPSRPPLMVKRPPLAHFGRLAQLERLLPRLPWPHLSRIEEPAASYTWGDVITLEGRFPELTTAAAGTYRAFSLVVYLDHQAIITELPIVSRTEGKLDVRLTTSERKGWAPVVYVTRTVDGHTYTSNELALQLEVIPPGQHEPVPTRIDSISPSGQFAGDRVFIRGLNLHTGPFEWELVDAAPGAEPLLIYPLKRSDEEVELRLPRTMVGGRYRVRCLGGFATGVPSGVVEYDVGVYRFRIEPTSLVCVDETNPELGSDDIVLSWVVAGDQLHDGNSAEMSFGEDGVRRDFAPGSLPFFTGNVDTVRMAMVASMTLTEWDQAEVEAGQRILGAVSAIAKALMPLLTTIPVGLVIASVVSIVADLVSWFLSWNGNDLIATHTFSWQLPELLALTANASASFTVDQQFYGDGGHYDLFFKVSRVV